MAASIFWRVQKLDPVYAKWWGTSRYCVEDRQREDILTRKVTTHQSNWKCKDYFKTLTKLFLSTDNSEDHVVSEECLSVTRLPCGQLARLCIAWAQCPSSWDCCHHPHTVATWLPSLNSIRPQNPVNISHYLNPKSLRVTESPCPLPGEQYMHRRAITTPPVWLNSNCRSWFPELHQSNHFYGCTEKPV